MKTPREILFERHESIEPKLGKRRRDLLEQMKGGRSSGRGRTSASFVEVLRSFRWHLAGMSAVWVLVLMLNIEQESAPTAASVVRRAPSAGTLLAAIRESRRLLLDIMELSVPQPAVDPGPKDLQRRGGLWVMTMVAQCSSVERAAPSGLSAIMRIARNTWIEGNELIYEHAELRIGLATVNDPAVFLVAV